MRYARVSFQDPISRRLAKLAHLIPLKHGTGPNVPVYSSFEEHTRKTAYLISAPCDDGHNGTLVRVQQENESGNTNCFGKWKKKGPQRPSVVQLFVTESFRRQYPGGGPGWVQGGSKGHTDRD